MDNGWIIFEGENGINDIFDKAKKHKGDDALVPFKTKQPAYEEFSGVVGAFSRIMSDISDKKKFDMNAFRQAMRAKVEGCSDEDFEALFQIVQNLYFENEGLLPVNVKALSYVEWNIAQKQVAEYVYGLFVEATDLKEKYKKMASIEDSNVLQRLVFDSLDSDTNDKKATAVRAKCFLPYVKSVFCEDYETLTEDADMYQKYIYRFLAYYYMYYVSQLAVKLSKFEKGKKNEIEKIYITMCEEVVTKVRLGYEYGWKYVKDKISQMFSHSVVMELLSHNVDDEHMDYIDFFARFNGAEDDEKVSNEIRDIREKYMKWIPLDYSKCKHNSKKDSSCKTSTEIKKLFETIDFQFINGTRKGHYNGYNKRFIEFVQKNFGKSRGVLGYTLSVYENDIVMFTRIILKGNNGNIKLDRLFKEFEKRGLLFDRESKKKIVDLYEKMNFLEKRSDSGDAQYVKYIL